MHIIVIKQYPCDSYVTIVPHAQSWYVLNDMPLKRAAASKKKELVWTDNEAELLLTWAEQSGCDPFLLCVTWQQINHVTIGWHRFIFAIYTSIFTCSILKSPLTYRPPDSEVSLFGMRFHRFGVNRRLKWREKYSFLTETYSCTCDRHLYFYHASLATWEFNLQRERLIHFTSK